ncbi:MAG: DUF4445 domain-containing protein [Hyphomicrobiaceae bacterium]|nr:DUF4445 domain-containing protein [Hyphomicrobiaceae bacterium]MCC0023409.1 DUF4445 domain-containing protein [Hyphomicrobiaceae bacterium]
MSVARTAKVIFQPSGKRGTFALGTPVLDAARELGVQIESVCGGRGICGRCQIEIAEGEFAKFGVKSSSGSLSERGFIEDRYDQKRGLKPGRRLSCTARIEGDLVVDVPDASIIAGQTIRKDANTVGMLRNPAVRPFYLELPEPDLNNPVGDADRVIEGLKETFDLEGVRVPFALLDDVQTAMRVGKCAVTAFVSFAGHQPALIRIVPGYDDVVLGLAVDIGSTTIAAHLVDLMNGQILASSGRANPQIRFGEDLMSRVSYVMMNEGGREKLTEVVRGAINELVDEVLKLADQSREALLDAVYVANPVMHHLFLGLDPTPLGQAPFNPAVSAAVRPEAMEIGLNLGAGATCYVLPIIAGHVGADAAAVLLAERPDLSPNPCLIVDIGTNAEIALWDGERLFAASSPTGPALEGAEISCGQRAAPGAIERIRIDRNTLDARYKIIGAEAWSDEDGFADQSAATGVTGVCGSGIIEIVGEMLLSGIISPDGIIRGPRNADEETKLIANGRTFSFVVRDAEPRLTITQTDVRAVQLAKGALYAGVKLLMEHAGLESIGDIRLAGAFGSYVDPAYALLLGLVPDCDVNGVRAIGNAAGQGALKALLDIGARKDIEGLVTRVTKIETALEPRFQTHFVAAMGVPNGEDAFALTRAHFGMDAAASKTEGPARRRRRSRDK